MIDAEIIGMPEMKKCGRTEVFLELNGRADGRGSIKL